MTTEDPWRLNAWDNGFISLIPDDLRYFQSHFVGRSMTNSWEGPPRYRLMREHSPIPDFVGWYSGAPVVSTKALSILSGRCATDFEALDFGFIRDNQFKVINILKVIDLVDMSKSDIRFYGNREDGVAYSIVLRPHEVEVGGIFKLSGINSAVFVSSSLAEALVEAELKGFGLTKLTTNVLSRALSGDPMNDYPQLSSRGHKTPESR